MGKFDRGTDYSGYILGTVFCFVVLLVVGVIWVYSAYTFSRDCGSHLKLAADANTIELASEQLGIAVKYLDDHKLTEGNSALLFPTGTSDIGFWHKNLSTSLKELNDFPPNATNLEKSNQLIKLRETLLDHSRGGDAVTCPDWIYVYPRTSIIWLMAISIAGCILFGIGWFIKAA